MEKQILENKEISIEEKLNPLDLVEDLDHEVALANSGQTTAVATIILVIVL